MAVMVEMVEMVMTMGNSDFDYINGIPYADSNEILFTPEGMVKIETRGSQ